MFAELGQKMAVRVVTENWFDLLSRPKEVHYVLDSVGHSLGLFGGYGHLERAFEISKFERSIFALIALSCQSAFWPRVGD